MVYCIEAGHNVPRYPPVQVVACDVGAAGTGGARKRGQPKVLVKGGRCATLSPPTLFYKIVLWDDGSRRGEDPRSLLPIVLPWPRRVSTLLTI